VVLALAAAGVYWGVRLLGTPTAVAAAPADGAAGFRVQETVAQLLLREARLSRRREPLVVTDAELNAFLGRHGPGR
jgi:hypothetical protein